MELNFLCKKKILARLKKVFCYENKLTFPIYVSDQKFENSMELLLLIDGDKSHYDQRFWQIYASQNKE